MDAEICEHFGELAHTSSERHACEECVKTGSSWVHLRLCMVCGHIGCCDASPNRHATAHHRSSRHAVIRSQEPGEAWGYCYEDDLWVEDVRSLAR